jgi:hypothetical protein
MYLIVGLVSGPVSRCPCVRMLRDHTPETRERLRAVTDAKWQLMPSQCMRIPYRAVLLLAVRGTVHAASHWSHFCNYKGLSIVVGLVPT